MSRKFVHHDPQSVRRNKAYVTIIAGLKERGPSGFNDTFEHIWADMKKVYEATGQEMMRLRIYEHLQNLVGRGDVDKDGKLYAASAKGLKFLEDQAEEQEVSDE